MEKLILVLNPGSTSTKFAVYQDDKPVFEHTIRHAPEELSEFKTVNDQREYRKSAILKYLKEVNFNLKTLSAVIGRGGGVRPIESGTFEVCEKMLKDLNEAVRGEHASNLGGIIAYEIAQEAGTPSYIADPPVVDELCELARYTGLSGYERESKFHALNQKAVAKRFCHEKGKSYQDTNIVVAHLGGGISVGAHQKGKVIDVTDAFTGDGAFSPERAGGLPTGVVVGLCFSGEFTKREVVRKLVGKGGIYSYLGTTDMRDVKKKIKDGDLKSKEVYEAMAYQVAKDIGAMATVLSGDIDQIILTGGIAYDGDFIELVRNRVDYIAGVTVYAGEDELDALAKNALCVLTGEYKAKKY